MCLSFCSRGGLFTGGMPLGWGLPQGGLSMGGLPTGEFNLLQGSAYGEGGRLPTKEGSASMDGGPPPRSRKVGSTHPTGMLSC